MSVFYESKGPTVKGVVILMFKMVIVDDEEFTRQEIRESVNWGHMDIEIVGEADNGLTAMVLIHDVSPDILICDIRMPKLDGISLVNELQSSCPDLQVLFLSGYSDKEYLKNAIKLEAVDYIYKPFQLHELISAVEKAKKNCLNKKSKSIRTDMDIALELLQYDSKEARSELFSQLPIKLDSSILSIVIKLNLSDVLLSNENQNDVFDTRIAAGHYYTSFRNAASGIFDGKFVMSCVGSGYIIHANVPPDYLRHQMSSSRLSEFFNVMDSGRTITTVGVGNPCSSVETLRTSYGQARDAAQAAFLIGYGKLIFFDKLSKEPFVPYTDVQEKLYENILGNNFTAAISYLENYINYMCGCQPQDISAIKDALASITFWINEHSERFSTNQKNYIIDMINYAPEIRDVKRYLMQQVDNYVNNIANLDNKGRILLEVEQYIMQNYDKDLSIKTIAQKVFITPNYLCYLYKNKTKRTLYQFILDVKMEKAQNMLCESNKKLAEVAEALGYGNQTYFTKIFTKYYGMSPRIYRNKNGKTTLVEPEYEEE